MRVLVAGWFSFELMGSTAGDVMACDVLCGWLRDAGIDHRVAMHEPTAPAHVATDAVDPAGVDAVIFVCGPIGNGPPLTGFLERFAGARLFAVDVTLLQPRAVWNPFERVIERDGEDLVNADLAFAAPHRDVPVVGVLLVGPQAEHPTNRHADAERLIDAVLAGRGVARVPIDTRLDVNAHGLRSAAQVESVIGRMDAVITTRLHGAVLALRRGVAPVAIDSVPGGSKLLAQMRAVDWPLAFDVACADERRVGEALDRALSAEGRTLARRTAARAARLVEPVRDELLAALLAGSGDRR